MATFTRTEADVLGSHASPVSIAGSSASTTNPLDLTGANTDNGVLAVTLIIGSSPPASGPILAFQESLDGTNYETVVTYVCPNAASTRYPYFYTPSSAAVKKSQCVITNGATNAITAYGQTSTRTVT